MIFAFNCCKKITGKCSLFLKCTLLMRLYEKSVCKRGKKNLENVYVEKKVKLEYLIYPRFYNAKLPTVSFMQIKEFSEKIT